MSDDRAAELLVTPEPALELPAESLAVTVGDVLAAAPDGSANDPAASGRPALEPADVAALFSDLLGERVVVEPIEAGPLSVQVLVEFASGGASRCAVGCDAAAAAVLDDAGRALMLLAPLVSSRLRCEVEVRHNGPATVAMRQFRLDRAGVPVGRLVITAGVS